MSYGLIQRSLEGLIRSLLYQILAQQPDLTSLVIKMALLDLNRLKSTSWRAEQLKGAFRTAVEEFSKTECLCLFIGGLDEYDGTLGLDTWDMLDFIYKLVPILNVKACVSSRPEPVFLCCAARFRALQSYCNWNQRDKKKITLM